MVGKYLTHVFNSEQRHFILGRKLTTISTLSKPSLILAKNDKCPNIYTFNFTEKYSHRRNLLTFSNTNENSFPTRLGLSYQCCCSYSTLLRSSFTINTNQMQNLNDRLNGSPVIGSFAVNGSHFNGFATAASSGQSQSSATGSGGGGESGEKSVLNRLDEAAPPPTTITFKEGAKTASQLSVLLGIGALVVVAASLIIRELMPTRMSPNSIFNKAFERVKNDPVVTKYVGGHLKAYGRDFSQSKEGRRNYIDHDKYYDLDGVKHVRVKFVVEGDQGKVDIFAEVSQKKVQNVDGGDEDFVYLIVNPRVRGVEPIALVDNRVEMPLAEKQEKIANKLVKANVKLYGASEDIWTSRQLVELGDFAKNISQVMCNKPEHAEECREMQMKGLPTWVVGQEKLTGFLNIDQLEELARNL